MVERGNATGVGQPATKQLKALWVMPWRRCRSSAFFSSIAASPLYNCITMAATMKYADFLGDPASYAQISNSTFYNTSASNAMYGEGGVQQVATAGVLHSHVLAVGTGCFFLYTSDSAYEFVLLVFVLRAICCQYR